MKTNINSLSVFGIPLLGLAALIVCQWYPQGQLQSKVAGSQNLILGDPSPQLDKSMTIFLRQEAKNVAFSRQHRSLNAQAQTIAEYNLIAQECTPAVFQATHLPPTLGF